MRRTRSGFTFVEIIISLLLLGLVASVIFPTIDLAAKQSKERELKQALNEIRTAIDAYKEASDNDKIPAAFKTTSGYPPNLNVLTGIPAKNSDMKVHRFVRKIPADPFFLADTNTLPENTWGKRSYLSESSSPKEGEDVFDIYSLSQKKGSNGRDYDQW